VNEIVLVATPRGVVRVDVGVGSGVLSLGLDGRPTALAADPHVAGRAWCCTSRAGVFRTDDGGATWSTAGLGGERLESVVASPARRDLLWAGTEPSAVWRSDDAGAAWRRTSRLEALPSSAEWSFPPRPDTHHVRWIAPHPDDADRLWVAVEAGALISTADGGATWSDRVPGGPYDTHELAIHPGAADVLRASAGDGYYESRDRGRTWSRPMEGMDVGYLRSVAIDPGDPEVVVVSAASQPHAAYVAGRSDGRLYRRERGADWTVITDGWPDPPRTIAPLLVPGADSGSLWACDERGVHRSGDGGSRWRQVWAFDVAPEHLRGIAIVRQT
jgi:photosystem II stability/assembly factor-like uncharacterized protein